MRPLLMAVLAFVLVGSLASQGFGQERQRPVSIQKKSTEQLQEEYWKQLQIQLENLRKELSESKAAGTRDTYPEACSPGLNLVM